MNINQRRAGVILSYMGQAVHVLTGLIYTPIMIRLLGQSEYGLYQLVFSVVSYLSLFSLGFTAAYVRFYARYKSENKTDEIYRLNGMFMTVFLIIAGITVICGALMVYKIRLIFSDGLSDSEYGKARILMALMIVNMAITFPNSVLNCILSAHERFFFQKLLFFLQSLLNPFITLPLLILGFGSVSMVVITTALTFGQFLLNIYYVKKKLKERFVFNHFNFALLKEIWAFTFFIFLNQIIDQINWNVDKFLLGRMIGTSAVAVYGLGGQINNMYITFSGSVSSVFVPKVNLLVAEGNKDKELSALFIKIGRIQFFILSLILSGFCIFGKEFMRLWGGSGYGSSYYVVILLIAPVTVPLIQNLGIEIQRAKNMHKARSIVYLCIAVLNILISIPFVKWWGPVGAAIGTALSLFLGNILFMNWYYAVKMGIEIKAFWKSILSILPSLIIPIALGILTVSFINVSGWVMLSLCIILYTIVFSISVYNLGMNDYEKSLVTSILSKIKKLFNRKNNKREV